VNGTASSNGYAILGIGGAHIDRIGRVTGDHHAAVSNPGHLLSTVGGGVLNALRTARIRGANDVAIISARGGDADGLAVEAAISEAGINDLSAVFLDRRTASYTAILDHEGELVTGLADMDIYETALPRQLRRKVLREAIAGAQCILVDANLPEAGLQVIAETFPGRIHAIAVSPAKAPRLLAIADRLGTVFMNHRELAALTGKSGPKAVAALPGTGIRQAAITDGTGDIAILEGTTLQWATVPAVETVRDVTGAGDALAGATIARMSADPETTLAEAVRDGIAAAAITVRHSGPVASSLTGPQFDAIRAQIIVKT
jgi:pseudouridine kinase